MSPLKQGPHPIAFYLRPDKQYSQTDLAYAAGYFDGEGTITTVGGGLRIRIASSDYRAIEVLARLFGGPIRGLSEKSLRTGGYTPGRRFFDWMLSGSNTLEPLRAMLPYLRSKDKEALVVLESGLTFGGSRGGRIPEDQRSLRREIESKLKSLKGAGRQSDYPTDIPIEGQRARERDLDSEFQLERSFGVDNPYRSDRTKRPTRGSGRS